MRKLGVNLNCYAALPFEEQAALMKANGFETTFCVSSNEGLEEAVPACDKYGIKFDNLHAPFKNMNEIWKDTEEGEAVFKRLLDCADKCERYGIPAMVVHLSSGLKPPHVNDLGVERFSRLMDYAAPKNVAICYENQRMLSNLAMAFEQFKDARFCWDCGHEFCFTPGRHYMPLFGDKLSALHIHDNTMVFNSDDHMIPGDAKIDFDYVASQIAKSGYEGTLMLEIIRRKTEYYADWTAEQYYAHAAERARDLCERIEKAKKA